MSDYVKAVFSTKDSGCTSSSGYHYWKLVSDLPVSTLTGKYRVKCSNCGMYYADYSSCDPEKEAETAYANNVSSLPASGYTSAGGLLWQPRWIEDMAGEWPYTVKVGTTVIVSAGEDGKPVISDSETVHARIVGSNIIVTMDYQKAITVEFKRLGSSIFYAPVDGTYTQVGTNPFALQGLYIDDTALETTGGYWKQKTFGHLLPPSRITTDFYNGQSYTSPLSSYTSPKMKYGTILFQTPTYQIIPSSSTTINNTYNINTRVNNFQGDYYDNVTNNYYNNTTIINETTNNYYDMTTNNYYTMSNWSYDYQSRTYFVTLEDGTTITVQFGDDCLTITNNNVENSYQYVIKNGGSSPDTPAACKHNWTETIDAAPTCLEGGHANYTCSLCGETYEQILSAKGHNWTVKEHVNTVYGENGQIVTQGHTLYECSACGEQWYTETAAPPPDVSGGGTIISWLTNFQTWLGDMLSVGLTVNLGSIVDKLQVLIDNSTSTVENTIVDIAVDSDAYNVFYVTDGDGNAQPVTEFAGDLTTASGKLLSLLYRLVFSGALETVDDDLDNFEDFFTGEEPVEEPASQNMDNAANEVIDVWGS